METTFSYFIFGGMLVGARFGLIGAGSDKPLLGIASGALAGAFIGWFLAAAFLEQQKKQK